MTDAVNPRGAFIECVRCRRGITATHDGVCRTCRDGEKETKAKRKPKEGDR